MLKLLVFIFFVTAVSAAQVFPGAPLVEGAIQCGGDGLLLATRVPGCTTHPCYLLEGIEHKIEIDFTTGAKRSDGYKLKVNLQNFGETVIDVDIPGNYLPNKSYTVSYSVAFSFSHPTLTITLRASLERLNDNLALELCSEFRIRVSSELAQLVALPIIQ